LENGVVPLIATDEDLENIPNPNESANMIGEILPNDWTPDGDN
jgi:hypothetical protein